MTETHDTVIVGGGPAAFSAGIYLARARVKAVLIESSSVMGQLVTTDVIENYPGVERTAGHVLLENMKKQAESFGLRRADGTVERILKSEEKGKPFFGVRSDTGEHKALSVVIASGARPRKLNISGEEKFAGRGVSYCATCDGPLFRDQDVVVAGGGDTAVEEALYLTRFAKKVYIIHRKDRLRATGIVQERAFAEKRIEFVWQSVIEGIKGGDKVRSLVIKNVGSGKTTELAAAGVFIFVGLEPNTAFLRGLVALDKNGGIIVDAEMKTSFPGIFACGDCCERPLHQVVTACGDGAIAANSARLYVEELKGIAYK